MKEQTKAKLNNLRVAPRKSRLLVDFVRGMNAKDAVIQLQFSKKHVARPIKKLIESAIANAVHNHNMDPETLVIKTAFVDEGKTLYRWMPRAFGRASQLRKRTSHITIVLEGDVVEKKEKKSEKEDKAEKKEKTEVKADTKKKTASAKKATASKKDSADKK